MMLEHRPEAGEVVRLDIIDEEDAVRVADIDHRRRAAAPARRRTDRQLDPLACRANGWLSGISFHAKRGVPMSMVTLPSLATVAASIPLSVSMLTCGDPRSATSSAATQRAALPQAPTSPPSAFQMRMNTSAKSRRLERDHLVAADALVAVGDGAQSGRP